jgi:hypothetical protein
VNRDLVLATLVLGLCGSVVWLAGWLPRGDTAADLADSGRLAERRCWGRLWLPLAPAALALAALAGWAVQEPRWTDELLRPLAPIFVAPLLLVWLRAAFRAGRALVPPRVPPLAATLGLLRPRVVMGAPFCRRLDGPCLEAALAHEQAHVRHRDPLRIWGAQIATDLQWPIPAATRRFARWTRTLELARDEEARARGARGEDLAQALVAAVRLAQEGGRIAGARLTGPERTLPERTLIERIGRLLAPLREDLPRRGRWLASLALLAALGASVVFGVARGDLLVRALPFITS